MKYDISHLTEYKEKIIGPIQADEAMFLYSLIKVVSPEIIVEFGFDEGYSALNFLKAMPKNCRLYSFDYSERAYRFSKCIKDKRMKFILKDQKDFKTSDIDNKLVDFLFFDASHELERNIITFNKIKKNLKKNAIIAIHDTGTWSSGFNERNSNKDYFINKIKFYSGYFLNKKEYIHQPDERRFVNYLIKKNKKLNRINIHSLNRFRHGLTILQKGGRLPM